MKTNNDMEPDQQKLLPVSDSTGINELSAQQPSEKRTKKHLIVFILAGIFLFCTLLGIIGVFSALFFVHARKNVKPSIQVLVPVNQASDSFSGALQNSSNDQNQTNDSVISNSMQNNQPGNQIQTSNNFQFSEDDIYFAVDYECAYIETENKMKEEGYDIHTSNYQIEYSNRVYDKMKSIMNVWGISDLEDLGNRASNIYKQKENKEFKQKVEELEKQRGCVSNK
jgi:hypothetical protein